MKSITRPKSEEDRNVNSVSKIKKYKRKIQKFAYIKYPVKLGFNDGSGKDENYITDSDEKVVVHGWGDCCRTGGIQEKNIALVIVKLLNQYHPKFQVPYFVEEVAKDV
jgi:hypothetical protein